MSLFNLFKKSAPDLSTWTITRTDEGLWEAFGIDSAAVVAKDVGLSNVILALENAERSRYSEAPNWEIAELQYAIYPWKQAGNVQYIFQVNKTDEGYTARDIQGSDLAVTGNSLEDLIAQIQRKIGDPETAMLQWVKPVKDLH